MIFKAPPGKGVLMTGALGTIADCITPRLTETDATAIHTDLVEQSEA